MNLSFWLLIGLFAVAIAFWAYGTREEQVPGRLGPAIIRALIMFLVLGGLALPAFRDRNLGSPERIILLDISRSMSLPVRAGDPTARSRLDSARIELALLQPDRVYLFGDNPIPVRPDSVTQVIANHEASLLEPALRAAKLGGADSVWVITDGDLSDRSSAITTAQSLGLGLREVRVATPTARVGLAGLSVPGRARSGDTVRVVVELRAGGDVLTLPDTVTVELRDDDKVLATQVTQRPAPGRTGRVEMSFVPHNPTSNPVWKRYEVVLAVPGDPFGVSDRVSAWMEISESTGGAVFVSTVSDWEGRFLVPVLGRLVLGGARGFLRLADGRYLELSANPHVVAEDDVRRALPGSRLLVVQAELEDVPDWLTSALQSHPRVLFLATGPGDVPSTDVRVSGPLPGEWYAMLPIPASPAAPLLADIDLGSLPPVREFYALDPPGEWSVLNASRNRRGERRPLIAAHQREDRRWVISATSEWWRWTLRGGASERVYDGVFSGMVGWLLEDATPQLVVLTESPTGNRPAVWRVRPSVTHLSIEIIDESGSAVWSKVSADPPTQITAPVLNLGQYEVQLSATAPEGRFRAVRPVEVLPDAVELLPGPIVEVANLTAASQSQGSLKTRGPRPAWPFVVAMLLLCSEWIWRHRIGLR
jgi:hypothetical protein